MPQNIQKKPFLILFALVLATTMMAAADGEYSLQPRYTATNALDTLTLYTINKFPVRVDTVQACSDNADPETKLYCALTKVVPSLFRSSSLEINIRLEYGATAQQTVSETQSPFRTQQSGATATTYGFGAAGTGYNAIFLDQGTLYVELSDLNIDTAVAIIQHLYDESYAPAFNRECIIQTSSNGKAIAFKNCKLANTPQAALTALGVQKITCPTTQAKTGIIALATPVNGQCPVRSVTASTSRASPLEFAGTETLPTVQQYIEKYLPQSVFTPGTRNVPNSDPCPLNNPDDDSNGFFGYRVRKQGTACAHFGIDLRGTKSNIGGKTVKTMLSGTIARVQAHYQSATSKDCVVVVDSGDWKVSYGHLALDTTYCTNNQQGKKVAKGDTIGLVSTAISPSNGNELDIKVEYHGAKAKLKELTVQRLSQKDTAYAQYSKYFDRYKTRAVIASSDFTFGSPNYDAYFLWEAYDSTLQKESTINVPTQTSPSVPASPPAEATTTIKTNGMSQACVYFYLDANDGSKDKFFDAGFAAYAGQGGACLVGRSAVAKNGINYPAAYQAYVNTAQLPTSESYEGCYVAQMSLSQHGGSYPSGAVVKMFLSKSTDAFQDTGPALLDKGIPRTEVGQATIGNPNCGAPAKITYASNAETGKQFLAFAKELNGLAYCAQSGVTYKQGCVDCADVVTYAYAKMLQAGYRLPPEFYAEMKKTQYTTKGGKKVAHPVANDHGPVNVPDVKVPKEVDFGPHLSDSWGGLLDTLGWNVPKEQAQPGDIALITGTNPAQCPGPASDDSPYDPKGCWKAWGHIEVVDHGSGSQIYTFGAGKPVRVHAPGSFTIDKVFRFHWIAPGQTAPAENPTTSSSNTVVLALQHDSSLCPGGSGTASGNLKERVEIVKVALKIRAILQPKGYNVLLTKEWKWNPTTNGFDKLETVTSASQSVADRIFTRATPCDNLDFEQMAKFTKNQNALAVALHFDSYGGGATAVYFGNRNPNPQSVSLAQKIYSKIGPVNGVTTKKGAVDDKGIGASSGGNGLIFLDELGKLGVTGVTVEMSSIDNPRLQSQTDAFEQDMAAAIAQGIMDFQPATKAGVGVPVTTNTQMVSFINKLTIPARTSCGAAKIADYEKNNAQWIVQYANAEGIDPVRLALALLKESNCEHFKSAGVVLTSLGRPQGPNIAVGIAQMKPTTGNGITVQVKRQTRNCGKFVGLASADGVETSIACAARKFKQLLANNRVAGNWENAWAAYNAGEAGDWTRGETTQYVGTLSTAYRQTSQEIATLGIDSNRESPS